MVSVHLLDILRVKHIIKHAVMWASGTYKTLCAKDTLTKVSERDLCNRHFPFSAIRYALAAQSLRDNLMTEAYSYVHTRLRCGDDMDPTTHQLSL